MSEFVKSVLEDIKAALESDSAEEALKKLNALQNDLEKRRALREANEREGIDFSKKQAYSADVHLRKCLDDMSNVKHFLGVIVMNDGSSTVIGRKLNKLERVGLAALLTQEVAE